MKNFDWDAFGKERNKIAVHCKTEEEAIDFCDQSHEHGYDWANGRSRAEETNWTWDEFGYGDETCYTRNCFTDIGYYAKGGYTILKWSDYMATDKPTFTKSDLKDGDMILRRNGVVEVAIPSINVFISLEGYMRLDGINEDFSDNNKDEEWDIVVVRRPTQPYECQFSCFESELGELEYKREEITEMTLEEICEALGKKIKIMEG